MFRRRSIDIDVFQHIAAFHLFNPTVEISFQGIWVQRLSPIPSIQLIASPIAEWLIIIQIHIHIILSIYVSLFASLLLLAVCIMSGCFHQVRVRSIKSEIISSSKWDAIMAFSWNCISIRVILCRNFHVLVAQININLCECVYGCGQFHIDWND